MEAAGANCKKMEALRLEGFLCVKERGWKTVVSQTGLEPATNWLRASYSAIELLRYMCGGWLCIRHLACRQ